MTKTLPNFTGRTITGGLSETKQQSRMRNDVDASARYARRRDIDRHNDDKALQEQCREVWE